METPRINIEWEVDGLDAAVVIVMWDDGTIEIKGRNITSRNAPEIREAIRRLLNRLDQFDQS